MRCPECGLENLPQLERCLRCGRGLRAQLTPWREVAPPRRAERMERRLNAAHQRVRYGAQGAIESLRHQVRVAPSGLRRFWNLVWYQADTGEEALILRRSPTLALILSLIPGLGHAYVRRWLAAAGLLALFAAGIVFTLLNLHSAASNYALLALLGLELFAMTWATQEARGQNPTVSMGGGLFSAFLLAAALWSGIYTAGVLMASQWHQLVTEQQPLSASTAAGSALTARELVLDRGDTVLVDIRRATRGRLRAGDLVLFVEPTHQYMMVQRIMAGPGDAFSFVGGRMTRNGRTLTSADSPLLPTSRASLSEVTLQPPAGQYVLVPYQVLMMGHGGGQHGEVLDFQTVSIHQIRGKVTAILNPPGHRRWF